MSDTQPMFRFRFLRASVGSSNPIFLRWDSAVPVTVLASSEDEAIKKVHAASRDRFAGASWTFRLEGFDEERWS